MRSRPLRAALALFAACLAVAAIAAPIPVETLFRKPQYGGAVLSPSGRYLAVLTPIDDRRNLAVIDLETRQPQATTSLKESDALSVFWLNDDRMVLTYGEIERASGEAPRTSGVVAIDRDGRNDRDLRRGFGRPNGVVVLRGIPGTDDVFVTARDRDAEQRDLYRLNTRTGERKLLSFDTPGQVSDWVLGLDGVPRAVVTSDLDRDRSAWYYRKSADGAWILGGESKLNQQVATPVAFSPDGKTLYLSRRVEDRSAIVEFDVESGKFGETILKHPERDVRGNFVTDLYSQRLLGYSYADDRPSVAWFDAEHARVQKGIDAALKDTVNFIFKARAGDRWLVVSGSDRAPGSVYLLDGKTFKLEKVLDYAPWIKPAEMSAQKWVRYTARDGRTIPALLTVPNGAEGKRVPLVVDIHGGPYVNATAWGYNAEVQFLASRGYAVLQPQFRGTDGFGFRHFAAGFRKWGESMQDDLVDGVTWAVKEGIADKDRVCFYGASYGGYAAMWGAIRDRDVIKCSVAYVGVSSIDYLFDAVETDIARLVDRSSYARVQIGDPATDRARWKSVNPLDNADKAGVPILLAYGMNDRRVPIRHGTDFRAALDRNNKTYEWVTYAGEGHGFNKTENVVDFYRRVEKFLARYLDKP